MIFNVKRIINFLSQGTTLLPGDVIMTGTPEGCPLSVGSDRRRWLGKKATALVERWRYCRS